MKTQSWKYYVKWIAAAEGAGLLSSLATQKAIADFNDVAQSVLTPPNWAFPVVWSVLFLLMGIGAARVEHSAVGTHGESGLSLFVVQLAVNFFWNIFFFRMRWFGFSLLWLILLWVLILAMARLFYRTDHPAAFLQIPYLAWVGFAGYLNLIVWLKNP